jgi:hypothetical protein
MLYAQRQATSPLPSYTQTPENDPLLKTPWESIQSAMPSFPTPKSASYAMPVAMRHKPQTCKTSTPNRSVISHLISHHHFLFTVRQKKKGKGCKE